MGLRSVSVSKDVIGDPNVSNYLSFYLSINQSINLSIHLAIYIGRHTYIYRRNKTQVMTRALWKSEKKVTASKVRKM